MLARRFIVLDLAVTGSSELLGLAAVTVALGGTYWLVRERDDRPASPPAAGAARGLGLYRGGLALAATV